MAKNIRRMLAMVLVMCMFIAALPMQALAAEGDPFTKTETFTGENVKIETPSASEITVSGTNNSGAALDISGSSESKSDSYQDTNTGSTIQKDTTHVELSGSEGDKAVEYMEDKTVTTETETDGTVTTQTTVDGLEIKEWTEEDAGNESGLPKVDVALTPGATTTGTASSTTVEGSVSDNGGQTTTTTADRTVTATTTEGTVQVTVTDTTLNALQPELKFDRNNTTDQANQKKETDLYTDNGHFTDPSTVTWTGAPEDYPFQYVGSGDYSGHYVSHIRVIYERDENGNALKDENGEYIIKELQHSNGTVLTKNGVPTTDINGPFDQTTGTRPTMFMLMNEEGDAVYGYCIDLETPTASKQFYQVGNLEDNDYYASEDAENHVRNIALNGYWGTAEGTGSIEKIREDLKAAVAAGTIEKEYDITFVIRGAKYTEGYELQEGEYVGNGYICKQVTEHVVLTDEVIDAMTEGEAMDATQCAIWTYANGAQLTLDGNDGMIVGDLTYASCALGDSLNKQNDYAGAARTQALYTYLVNLDTELKSTIVINDKNNVEDMQLTIGDKVFNHVNNLDNDQDNDVYHAEVKFSLAFTPNAETDDLLVYLTDSQGNTVNDANGNPIVKRLAGKDTEERSADTLVPDDNGVYTLTNLQLGENEDQTFGLRLEGSQYLEQGVYIYTAEGGTGASQTMVGVAEGTNTVDITNYVTFNFDVDENDHIVQERVWHNEFDPVITPPEDPEPPTPPTPPAPPTNPPVDDEEEEDEPVPAEYRMTNQDGGATQTIEDEPVPLADAPKTGDESGMIIAMIIILTLTLFVVNYDSKKIKI